MCGAHALILLLFLFFFTATATTEIYTLSLHDALPIFRAARRARPSSCAGCRRRRDRGAVPVRHVQTQDRKSTRLNSSHLGISYAVFCLKKKKRTDHAHMIQAEGEIMDVEYVSAVEMSI